MKELLQILLVEDNPGDVRLAGIALERSGLLADYTHASNGEEALRLLEQLAENSKESLPDLVILDLNLPIIDGREVLSAMKKNTDLQNIPVVVLTSSDHCDDIKEVYRLNAAAYFCKPENVQGFERILKQIIQLWPDYQLCHEDLDFQSPIAAEINWSREVH